MATLVLTSSQVQQIRREGAETYPNECCGIIIGQEVGDWRIVERLAPMENVFDPQQQRRRFAVDGLALMRAEKMAAENGQVVLGFYHSHPDHPARPSEFDRQHAWPYYSYVIISIAQREPGEMTNWILSEQTEQFVAQGIQSQSV